MDEPETTAYDSGIEIGLDSCGYQRDIGALTMVQRYFGGRLDDRSGAKDDIAMPSNWN